MRASEKIRAMIFFFYRSPLDKTYEMGGAFQFLRQEGREPVSAALRITVESRRLFAPEERDFRRFQATNLVFPVSRAVGTVAEVFVVPMVSFNANPFASSLPLPPAPRACVAATWRRSG